MASLNFTGERLEVCRGFDNVTFVDLWIPPGLKLPFNYRKPLFLNMITTRYFTVYELLSCVSITFAYKSGRALKICLRESDSLESASNRKNYGIPLQRV
jgi:hypothetical protein